MKSPFTLALDIGTSSIRAAIYDGNATLVRRASVKIACPFTSAADGAAEIDVDAAFSGVVAAIDAVLEKTRTIDRDIEFAATCAYWHSLVGVDAKGKPTTKVFGWADSRSRKYTEVLRDRFDERETHDRTGARFHSSYWPAKLIWLSREFPDIFARTERWLSFSDYVALKLYGIPATSVSIASGTGIYDIRGCSWDHELLDYLKIRPSNLAAIDQTDAATFQLAPSFALRWPRLKKTRWFPAVADGAADNVGSGCVTKGRAALMIGTSGAMRVAYRGEPPRHIPDGLWCYRINRERVILGGALSDGGGLYAWLRQNLKVPAGAADEMRRRGADAQGLTFLPFFAGERGTGYNENAKGAILGLTMAHDSIDILQAGMESVAYRFAEIFDRLNSVRKINEIVLSGGALRDSPIWAQIIADVLGRNLVVYPASESSSRGAVLLALENIGKIEVSDNIQFLSRSEIAFHPACHALYKIARKRHQEAYDSNSATTK